MPTESFGFFLNIVSGEIGLLSELPVALVDDPRETLSLVVLPASSSENLSMEFRFDRERDEAVGVVGTEGDDAHAAGGMPAAGSPIGCGVSASYEDLVCNFPESSNVNSSISSDGNKCVHM